MIERTPIFNAVTYAIMIGGLLVVLLPVWMAFTAATQTVEAVNRIPFSFALGDELLANLGAAWQRGDFGTKLANSFILAAGVTLGKVMIAALSAFSIVYFNYRLRMIFFWIIFVTLMLPLEVRIVPTYAVAANALAPLQAILDVTGISALVAILSGVEVSLQWNLLNSYVGLILPLVATATGTFLYRQFFMTVPDELAEAAKMDGAGAFRFFVEILMPLSRTNMLALATIMFVYAWNQYLWPLLVTTDRGTYGTAIIELKQMVPNPYGGLPDWNVAMAAALIVMLPPVVVVALMQRWFVRGLIATEK